MKAPVALTVVLGSVVIGLFGIAAWMMLSTGSASPPPAGVSSAKAAQFGAAATDAELGVALRLGDQAIAESRFDSAIAQLQRATERWPASQDLRLKLAQAFVHSGQHALALAEMEQALAIGPDLGVIRFDAGTIAVAAGDLAAAVTHYQAAQQKMPNQWKVPLYLAMVHIRKRDDLKARAELVRAVTLNAELPEAWGTLADLELRQNNLDLAAGHIAKARKLAPDVAAWRVVDAKVLKRSNQPQQAAELLLALDEQDRFNPAVLQVLAECLGLLGKPLVAAEQYAAAYERSRTEGALALSAARWFVRAQKRPEAERMLEVARRLSVPGVEEVLAEASALPGQ